MQLDEALREGLKVTTRRYAVLEQKGDGHRVFKWTKPMPNDGEAYFVGLPADGRFPVCDCVAGLKAGWCAHCEVIAQMKKQGLIPQPQTQETV